MADIKRQVEVTLTKRVQGYFPTARVKQAMRVAAVAGLDDIRDLASSRVNVDGSRAPNYRREYKQQKSRFIATGKLSSGPKARSLRKTRYAAKSVNDGIRLTGRTFSDMTVKSVRGGNDGGFLGGSFVLDMKSSRSRAVTAGLLKRGYNFWGIPRASTPAGKRYRDNFKRRFTAALGISGSGGNASINEV